MILVIDSSSTTTGLAVLDEDRVIHEMTHASGRDLDLPALAADLAKPDQLSAVAVATGPGSFTGLRVGAAYAVGLALGRRLPLLGLDSLELQRERTPVTATSVIEAGRGRVYYLTPDQERGLSAAEAVPGDAPAVGWLREPTASRLNLRLLPESELRSFGEAAVRSLGRAKKVAYDRVKLEYMQSFGWRSS